MNNNLIKIKNLTKNFINNKLVVKVLKNLNLELEMGNIVALIGPSGSGKSIYTFASYCSFGQAYNWKHINFRKRNF